MNEDLHSFVHLLFIGIIALFPVVNPLGSAFIITPYFANLTKEQKRSAVGKITFYAFCICAGALFAGHWILRLFGLTIPVIQLAGGIMICKMGWEFLSSDGGHDSTTHHQDETIDNYSYIQDKLFYPITFPVTTGAGTLSVLFTLSAHSAGTNFKTYAIGTAAILTAVIFTCILIYIFYLNAKTIISHLGSKGEMIINRLSAFLIFCVGLQIAISGIRSLLKGG